MSLLQCSVNPPFSYGVVCVPVEEVDNYRIRVFPYGKFRNQSLLVTLLRDVLGEENISQEDAVAVVEDLRNSPGGVLCEGSFQSVRSAYLTLISDPSWNDPLWVEYAPSWKFYLVTTNGTAPLSEDKAKEILVRIETLQRYSLVSDRYMYFSFDFHEDIEGKGASKYTDRFIAQRAYVGLLKLGFLTPSPLPEGFPVSGSLGPSTGSNFGGYHYFSESVPHIVWPRDGVREGDPLVQTAPLMERYYDGGEFYAVSGSGRSDFVYRIDSEEGYNPCINDYEVLSSTAFPAESERVVFPNYWAVPHSFMGGGRHPLLSDFFIPLYLKFYRSDGSFFRDFIL